MKTNRPAKGGLTAFRQMKRGGSQNHHKIDRGEAEKIRPKLKHQNLTAANHAEEPNKSINRGPKENLAPVLITSRRKKPRRGIFRGFGLNRKRVKKDFTI